VLCLTLHSDAGPLVPLGALAELFRFSDFSYMQANNPISSLA
jgi:hypothetical protein